MNCWIHFFSIFAILITISSASFALPYSEPLFINCGLLKSTNVISTEDHRSWKSDDDPAFAPPNINTISTSATASANQNPPYDTARLFQSPLTYSFSLTPGPKFLRLHFTTSTSYNNIPHSQFFLSLRANDELIIFKNFSAYLNSRKNKDLYTMYEFHLTVENGGIKNLNLTFSPGDGTNNNKINSYGFINAMEIVPIPEGLYVDNTRFVRDVDNPQVGYEYNNITALQTAYRLNVGGSDISPVNDSGSMWRRWEKDDHYLAGNFPWQSGGLQYDTRPELNYTMIPKYVAPGEVYATRRVLGDYKPEFNLKQNLTWRFDVDPGFEYLLRLHFCEMFKLIKGSTQRMFIVYINNKTADEEVDVWALSGGLGVPVYKDYVIQVDDGSNTGVGNGTKVDLWLALHPKKSYVTDVLLNGLEIFKLSNLFPSNNLAVPNPSEVATSPPSVPIARNSNHHSLPIIGGAIGGAILVSLLVLACLVIHKRRKNADLKKKFTAAYNSSKDKWTPSIDSGTTKGSSLPSDICRSFSLAQIRVATSDFDESLIIGIGGFGKVYKGSIDGEATKMAIKRLNSTSKQGAHEFQTEIEMLSRLRHVHLVSLIGYCEEQGEMILVYEYMPRGTLRDHLLYKNPGNNNNMPLSWKQRLAICIGSARGLNYLHSGTKQLIIHRDVKSTNILLDEKWKAKVSDFGISKVGPVPGDIGITHVSTAVKGSIGYLDPEYYRSQQLTEKSDVYSFGVVLFEVLCARPPMNPTLPKEQVNLAIWARHQYRKGTLHTIVDPTLRGMIATESLRKFGEIAEMCVRDRGIDRPSMGDVVWGLEFALQLQETAESNNVIGESLDEMRNPTSFTLNSGDKGVTYIEISSASGVTFSQSSSVESGTKRLLDSETATSN